MPSVSLGISEIFDGPSMHTLVEHVAERTVVKNHDLAKIRLDRAEILDECSMAECTMLAVVSPGEVFSFRLQKVNDRVGIFLDRSSKDNEVVPFGHLADN